MINWIKKKIESISDSALLSRAREGDAKSFEIIYLKYLDSLYRYVFFKTGQQKEVAEDLTQTIFMKAWKAITTTNNEHTSAKAWLFTIARNSVIDYYRQKKTLPLPESLPDEKPSLEETVETEEELQALLRTMKFLTQEQQEVILMKFVEEMKNSEIARILGKEETAVRALQSRALKKLREILTNT